MSRKVIGLLTASPESVNAQRMLEGVCARCHAYGYELAVFSSLVSVNFSQDKYLAGEMNIYQLINFDLLDGVIIDAISLTLSQGRDVIRQVTDLLEQKCKKPIVAVGASVKNYPYFMISDRPTFREIARHVMDVHGRKKVYFLTGPKGSPDSMDRVNGFKDVLEEKGLPFHEEHVFYGDFWYPSGNEMADRILSGEVERPDAVICANDHMAISLAKRLHENGIRVPEDIVITGFDATNEAAISPVSITTYSPDCSVATAEAVDALRREMDPGAPILPCESQAQQHMRAGMSCGCNHNLQEVIATLRESVYYLDHDFSSGKKPMDIGILLDSNMLEYLSDSGSPEECIHNIYSFSYLLGDYEEFYLCLDENWLNSDLCTKTGYPSKIRNVIHNTPELDSGHYQNGPLFHTRQMLPDLGSESHAPSAFYFMPVHFLDQPMGYAVLRHDLNKPHRLNCVVRNWLKNVSSGLEIIRTEHKLETLSTRDGMTGVYNRRGMELLLDQMLLKAKDNDQVLAFVIDMDKLKYINDTFGHDEGDQAIGAVCRAAMRITGENELCVRAGGDEFYVIGIGDYEANAVQERIERFRREISKMNERYQWPYTLSASIGGARIPLNGGMSVMGIVRIADAKMYESKVQNRMQRES